MTDALLTINVGSSSVRFALFEIDPGHEPRAAIRGHIEGIGTSPAVSVRINGEPISLEDQLPGQAVTVHNHETALRWLLDWIRVNRRDYLLRCAGHRVVHGGDAFTAPMLVDKAVLDQLARLIPLAPLHQPHNLAGIDTVAKAMPDLPQVACFDTAFHATQPAVARMFALPRRISEQGIKRYGFHGLSFEYIANALPDFLGDRANGRVVVAHLGNGASLCAVHNRKSIASTMGFSTLDGLMMGTRCGNLDPGVLLYLLKERGMDVDRLTDMLYQHSGLAGVSGISSDMHVLLAHSDSHAKEAVELFCYRVTHDLGAMAAVLGGLDALVFTGGIGEHAAVVRQAICEASGWLGVSLDPIRNANNRGCISRPDSRVAVCVIPADEELVIARQTMRALRLL